MYLLVPYVRYLHDDDEGNCYCDDSKYDVIGHDYLENSNHDLPHELLILILPLRI